MALNFFKHDSSEALFARVSPLVFCYALTIIQYPPKSSKDKIRKNIVEGAEHLYQEALLNWVDEGREGAKEVSLEALRISIADLWVAYANFYEKLGKVSICFV